MKAIEQRAKFIMVGILWDVIIITELLLDPVLFFEEISTKVLELSVLLNDYLKSKF
jgi:hypothetical protein